MKKLLILIVSLLFLSSCGPEFTVSPDQTPFFFYPALRVVIVNHTLQEIKIFDEKGKFFFSVAPKGIRAVDVNFCYEGNYVLVAKKPTGEVLYRTFWCNSYYSDYVRKEVWEIY